MAQLPKIELSDDLKRKFKAKCALEGCTMTDIIMAAILAYVEAE